MNLPLSCKLLEGRSYVLLFSVFTESSIVPDISADAQYWVNELKWMLEPGFQLWFSERLNTPLLPKTDWMSLLLPPGHLWSTVFSKNGHNNNSHPTCFYYSVTLTLPTESSSLNVWQNSPVKPSGFGLLFFGRFSIMVSISVLVIVLFIISFFLFQSGKIELF